LTRNVIPFSLLLSKVFHHSRELLSPQRLLLSNLNLSLLICFLFLFGTRSSRAHMVLISLSLSLSLSAALILFLSSATKFPPLSRTVPLPSHYVRSKLSPTRLHWTPAGVFFFPLNLSSSTLYSCFIFMWCSRISI
jgi:hypothetical protein